MPASGCGLLHRGRGDQPSARQGREGGAGRARDAPRDRRGCCRARRTPAPARPPASGLDGEVPRDPLEVGGDLAELTDGALQVGLPRGGVIRAPRQRLGVAPGAGRACRHLLDLLAQPSDRAELLRGRRGDAPARDGPPRRWSRRSRRAPARRRRSAPRRRPPPPGPRSICPETTVTWPPISSSSTRASPRRLEALRREVAYLLGHDGESAPFPARPGGLDRGVQRDQVGEIGDLADRADEAGDPAGQRRPASPPARRSPATNPLRPTSR